jgi:hypothetical protein
MVWHLLLENLAVVILGDGHDLNDNVPDGCEYVRVLTKHVFEGNGKIKWPFPKH